MRGFCLIFALLKKHDEISREISSCFFGCDLARSSKNVACVVFLTFGNHVFCYSPLGAFCVFLSVPFSVICSACSLGGGLNDVLFRGQPYAAIIQSTTTGNEHVTNETTAGGGRGPRHTHPPFAGPTYVTSGRRVQDD